MEILLIRHGKTRGNLEGRYIGRTDEPLLTEEAERLGQSSFLSFGPDVIYTSGMLRCRQTAAALFLNGREEQFPVLSKPAAGKPFTGKGVSLMIHPGLNEMDFGEFEYKNYEELKENPSYQAWLDSGGTTAFPGGESGAEFRARCRTAFLECIADAKKRNAARAAFVIHGGTIMAILAAFAVPRRDFYDWQVKNGEGVLAELEESEKEPCCLRFIEKGFRLKRNV